MNIFYCLVIFGWLSYISWLSLTFFSFMSVYLLPVNLCFYFSAWIDSRRSLFASSVSPLRSSYFFITNNIFHSPGSFCWFILFLYNCIVTVPLFLISQRSNAARSYKFRVWILQNYIRRKDQSGRKNFARKRKSVVKKRQSPVKSKRKKKKRKSNWLKELMCLISLHLLLLIFLGWYHCLKCEI